MAGRPGRDAKWKEGGTGLKAEMGNEGSRRRRRRRRRRGRLGRATAAAAAGANQPKTD